ncbi:MAG: peptidylprolyl isomerase [Actinobacteria bacterium]|nr:peptidylprolyl isomerase [Actinomycetota bacterium]
MATAKSKRQGQAQRSRVAAAQQAAERAKRRRRSAVGAIAVVGIVALVAGIATVVNASSGGDKSAASTGSSGSSTSSTQKQQPTVSLPKPPPGRTLKGATPCPGAGEARVAQFAQPPPMCIDVKKRYTATVKTSDISFDIQLDPAMAPTTVNNFVVLAKYGYFDGLPFHRVIPGFVVQGGSSGIPDYGTGEPGYDLGAGELPPSGYKYKMGDIAMAKAQTISGSQFFIVVGTQGQALPAQYPRFGTVTTGLSAVQQLAERIGTPGSDGTPTKVVTIRSVTITESG